MNIQNNPLGSLLNAGKDNLTHQKAMIRHTIQTKIGATAQNLIGDPASDDNNENGDSARISTQARELYARFRSGAARLANAAQTATQPPPEADAPPPAASAPEAAPPSSDPAPPPSAEPIVGERVTGGSATWEWMRPGGSTGAEYRLDAQGVDAEASRATFTFNAPAWTDMSERGGVGTQAEVALQLRNVETGEWVTVGTGMTGYTDETGRGRQDAVFEVENLAPYQDASGQVEARVVRADGETAHVGAEQGGLRMQVEPRPAPEPVRGDPLTGTRQTGHPAQDWVWMRPGGADAIDYDVDASGVTDPDAGGVVSFRAPAWTKQSEIGGVGTDAEVEVQLYNTQTGRWDTVGVGQTGYREEGGLHTAEFEVDRLGDYMDADGRIQARVMRADGETAHVGGARDSLTITPYETPAGGMPETTPEAAAEAVPGDLPDMPDTTAGGILPREPLTIQIPEDFPNTGGAGNPLFVEVERPDLQPVAAQPGSPAEGTLPLTAEPIVGERVTGGSATWEWIRPGGSTGAEYRLDAQGVDAEASRATFTFNAPAWTRQSELGGVGTQAEVALQLRNVETGEWVTVGTGMTGYTDETGRGRQDAVFEVEDLAPYQDASGQVEARVVRADGETAHVGAEQGGLRMQVEPRTPQAADPAAPEPGGTGMTPGNVVDRLRTGFGQIRDQMQPFAEAAWNRLQTMRPSPAAGEGGTPDPAAEEAAPVEGGLPGGETVGTGGTTLTARRMQGADRDLVWMTPEELPVVDDQGRQHSIAVANFQIDASGMADANTPATLSFEATAHTWNAERGFRGESATIELQIFNQSKGEWELFGEGVTGYDAEGNIQTASYDLANLADYMDDEGVIRARVLRGVGEGARIGVAQDSMTIQVPGTAEGAAPAGGTPAQGTGGTTETSSPAASTPAEESTAPAQEVGNTDRSNPLGGIARGVYERMRTGFGAVADAAQTYAEHLQGR